MRKQVSIGVLAFVLGAVLFAANVMAENFLEIVIDKYRTSEDNFYYEFGFGLSKEGATSCDLTNPTGTYACFEDDAEWYPELRFWQEHLQMSFPEVLTAIAGDWTVVWDEGLATETVAVVSFGTVAEGEFLEVPAITQPIDGSVGVPQDTSIDWTYDDIDPCTAQIDMVEVLLRGPLDSEINSDELPCETVSWTPPLPLVDGEWVAEIGNSHAIRDVPEGFDISGDPWVLDNTDWLDLRSIDTTRFSVGEVAVQSTSFGAVKLLYR